MCVSLSKYAIEVQRFINGLGYRINHAILQEEVTLDHATKEQHHEYVFELLETSHGLDLLMEELLEHSSFEFFLLLHELSFEIFFDVFLVLVVVLGIFTLTPTLGNCLLPGESQLGPKLIRFIFHREFFGEQF